MSDRYIINKFLTDPPLAPDNLMFVTQAIVHVGRATDPAWDDAELKAAFPLASPEDASTSAINRAMKRLAQAVISGRVTPYAQVPNAGWLPHKSDPEEWVKESLWFGIIRSGVAAYSGSGNLYYIFVDRSELTAAFPTVNKASDEAHALGLNHLSPYLRLMLHVARVEGVSPDNQPKLETLMSLIREHAPTFGLNLSDRQPKEIARLIRDPAQ